MKSMPVLCALALVLLAFTNSSRSTADAQGTAFTYHGGKGKTRPPPLSSRNMISFAASSRHLSPEIG